MNFNQNENQILTLLNEVTIKETELSDAELSDIEKRNLQKDVLKKIQPKFAIAKKKKWILVACSTLICMAMLVNKNTIAAINSFIFDHNEALKKAANNNYIQSVSTDFIHNNGVQIQVADIIIDKTKIAISFNLKFDDVELLSKNNIEGISMNLQVKDENDTLMYNYVDEDLTGKRIVADSLSDNCKFVNKDNGMAMYNVILNSKDCNIPKIKKLKINVKDVKLYNYNGNTVNEKAISGNWRFPIDVEDKFRKERSIKFVDEKNDFDVNIKLAQTTPTGTVIKFTAPKNVTIDALLNTLIVTNKGSIEKCQSAYTEYYDDYNMYTVEFPVTTFDNPNNLKLVIKNYIKDRNVEIKLNKK